MKNLNTRDIENYIQETRHCLLLGTKLPSISAYISILIFTSVDPEQSPTLFILREELSVTIRKFLLPRIPVWITIYA